MDSKKRLELRVKDLLALREAYDKQREQLLEKFLYLKGFLSETEKIIIEITQKINSIVKEEKELEAKEHRNKKEEEVRKALETARQAGNIGTHPSQREPIHLRKLKYQQEQQAKQQSEAQINLPQPQEEIQATTQEHSISNATEIAKMLKEANKEVDIKVTKAKKKTSQKEVKKLPSKETQPKKSKKKQKTL